MYTEASSPRRQGDKAQLISPTNPATAGSCLEFWYHMYGADVGQLNIYVRTGNVIPRTALWGESGNKGNEWKVAKVSVRANSPYEVCRPFILRYIRGTVRDTCLRFSNSEFQSF